MEVLSFTYSFPLLSNTDNACGTITFRDSKGKVRKSDYEVNKQIGKYIVLNFGTNAVPKLKIFNAK